MMKCESCQFHLSAFLDGEVPSSLAEELQSHVDQCPNCRRYLDELEEIDTELRGLKRSATGPEAVIATIESQEAVMTASSTSVNSLARLQPWALVIAIAACVLVVVKLRPFPTQPTRIHSIPVTPVAGQLVRATGAVEVLAPGDSNWQPLASSVTSQVPKGARIRTAASVACEIETSDRGLIRMNEAAELILHDADRMELVEGQAWFRAPQSKSLQVDLKDPGNGKLPSLMTLTCPQKSEFQCEVRDTQSQCWSFSQSTTELEMSVFRCPVGPGETVVVKEDQDVERANPNLEQATLWQLPLLAITPSNDQELRRRLEPMLISIGSTKLGFMNERQIQSLGPAGAIPLLAYVKSTRTDEDPTLRRRAMRIASENVDETADERLADLADDPDPVVSQLAAKALERVRQSAD